MPICSAIKKDGKPCLAMAGEGSKYCFHHDPDRKEEAEEARRKGGEASRLKSLGVCSEAEKSPLKKVRLNSLQDARKFLALTINEYREGLITTEMAKATAYICNILITAIKDSEIESKLRNLEELIETRGGRNVRI